ncbi:MAG: IS1634 family transposase [Methanolinea sp.]|nr:MAG: IS1634 family transposase [Methanolinea sp.]
MIDEYFLLTPYQDHHPARACNCFSDRKILLETIRKVQQNLNLEDKAYYIADSAFYTAPKLQTPGQHTFWISHPPATIDEAKSLLFADIPMISGKEEGYSFHERLVTYAGIDQKWIVVHSEKRRMAGEKNYVRNLAKRLEKARKSWKKLRAKELACEPDARMAARLWFDAYPYLFADSVQVFSKTKKKNVRKGRPGKDKAVETVYLVDSPLEIVPEVVEQEKARLGRFILATNDLDLDPDTILNYYKPNFATFQYFHQI